MTNSNQQMEPLTDLLETICFDSLILKPALKQTRLFKSLLSKKQRNFPV